MKTSLPNFRFGLISLVFGFAAHRLLMVGPPGINWPITVVLLLLGGRLALPRTVWAAHSRAAGLLALAAITTSAWVAVRASPTLTAINLSAGAIALGLMVGQFRDGRSLAVMGVLQPAWRLMKTGFAAFINPISELLDGSNWLGGPWQRIFRASRPVIGGIILALPLLCIFTALFASADAAFTDLLRRLLRFDLREFIGTAFWTAVIAWLVFGTLVHASRSQAMQTTPAHGGWLGATEICIALGLIAALFLVFVSLQFRYLFSAEPIGNDAGLNEFADHARRGFFELVTVAALALMVLLAADRVVLKHELRSVAAVRLLGMLISVLVFVIMASALSRMLRYTQAFGLTELRVYTTAFMLWIAQLFMWLMVTVLRGRRYRFAIGALISACGVVLVLNVLNVDDMIVRANMHMAAEPPPTASRRYAGFDGDHASQLSTDAYPALLDAMPAMHPYYRCRAAERMLASLDTLQIADPRTANHSRITAFSLLKTNEAWLRSVSCGTDSGKI